MPALEGNDKLQQKYWRDDVERAFWPLQTPLTSTDWDGDAYSTIGKTPIVMQTIFGTPPGVRAILFYASVRDTSSDAVDCYLILSPNDTAGQGMIVNASVIKARSNRECVVVPTDDNGDVYYQVVASGASSMNITLEVHGYWRHAGR